MAYDSDRDVVVLFGGRDDGSTIFDDTWEWDGDTWVRVFTDPSPPRTSDATMAYDSSRGVMVLFGAGVGASNATWEYAAEP